MTEPTLSPTAVAIAAALVIQGTHRSTALEVAKAMDRRFGTARATHLVVEESLAYLELLLGRPTEALS